MGKRFPFMVTKALAKYPLMYGVGFYLLAYSHSGMKYYDIYHSEFTE